MSKKFTFCIIGLGRAGKFHLESIRQLNSCTLKYVVDPAIEMTDPIVASNEFSLISDLKIALSDPKVDGVIVAAPTQYHYELICQSLQAGKHVFTEKPLGKSPDEIIRCFDLAKARDLGLFIGFQRRYDSNFIALKQRLQNIGKVRTVKMSSRDNPKPSLEYLRISGNIFHDMLIHDFDMLQFLLGEQIPEAVAAFGHAYDEEIKKIPDYDTVLVTLKYSDGLICAIDTSRTSAFGYDQRVELFAENGMAIAENQKNDTVEVHTLEGRYQNPINYSFPDRYRQAYKKEIESFVAESTSGKKLNVSKNQCLISHLIAEAALISAIEKRVIDFKTTYAKQLKQLE